MFDVKRTTLTVDDDVLDAARALAERRGAPIGLVLSELARRGLELAGAGRTRNGIRLFPVRDDAVSVTPELVKELLDEAAHAWAARDTKAHWLTSPLVQNGVIRVASQSLYPNHPGTSGAVRDVLRVFCANPRHEFCPDDISPVDAHVAGTELLTPSVITAVYLLALARHHRARLATFDRRIPVHAVPDGHTALELLGA
jgi:predicted nucleic acid-binding protein